MVAGKVVYKDGYFTNVDVTAHLLEVSERLQTAVAADPQAADPSIVQLTCEGKM